MAKNKYSSIEVEPYGDCGYFAKGHHDPETFCDAVQKDWTCDRPDPGRVQKVYLRVVPDSTGEWDFVLIDARPGRGAFPATLVLN